MVTVDETTQAPAQENAAPAAEPAPAPDPLGEAKAEIAKLQSQLQGMRGTLAQRLDLEAELRRLRRDMGRSLEVQDLVAKRLATVDPDALTEVQTLRQRHTEAETHDTLAVQANDLYQDIGEELADAFGHDLSTEEGQREIQKALTSQPELKGVQAGIQQAYDHQAQGWRPNAVPLLRAAMKEAKAVRRQADMTRKDREAKALEKAKADARNEALKEAGVTGMPAGRAAGGGGKRTEFTQEEIEAGGPAFIEAHFDEIKAAQRAGNIKPRGA